jgi:OOP family OmpA-OmpF porin
MTDYGAGINYGYGTHFGARRALELRLFADTQETGIKGATDFYQLGAGLDLFQYFGKVSGGHPYVVFAAGAIGNDVVPDSKDGVSAYLAAGLGWRSAPWKKWAFRTRVDLRGVYDTFDSGRPTSCSASRSRFRRSGKESSCARRSSRRSSRRKSSRK